MKSNKLILYILLTVTITITINACVVNKPDADNIGYADYNTRKTVKNPHYHKKLSGWGIASIAGGALAGGAAGYFIPMVSYQNGGNTINAKPANAAIGAVTGAGISCLINYAIGLNKTAPANDVNEWLKKTKTNYSFVKNDGYSSFIAINNAVEPNYSVMNLQDVKDFKLAFPVSQYADTVVKKGIPKVSRTELLELISLYPNNSSLLRIKTEYITRSTSISELFSAKDKFYDVSIDVEDQAYKLIYTIDDAEKFAQRFAGGKYQDAVDKKTSEFVTNINECKQFNRIFPKSKNIDNIVAKLSNTLGRNDLLSLVELYPDCSIINVAKKKYIITSKGIDDFINSTQKFPEEKISINYGDYSYNIDSAKSVYDQLLLYKDYLGSNNFERISNDLKNHYLEFSSNSSRSLDENIAYKTLLENTEWLKPISNSFIIETQTKINDIKEQIADNQRKQEFYEAKQKGPEYLIEFSRKYPNSPETSQVANELDQYARKYVKHASEPFYWVAPGDRTFWTAWAEGNRNWWKGSENYNYFVGGRLENNSNQTLKIEIVIGLNFYINSGVSIFRSTTSETVYQKFYMILNPGDEKPFVGLFDNISGGYQVGKGLLSAGKSIWVNESNPIKIDINYYLPTINESTLNAQTALIKTILKNGGNIDTKNWGGMSVQDFCAGGSFASSNDGKLTIKYSSEYDNPSLRILDSDGSLVKSDSWSSEGMNTGIYYLSKGYTYYIDVDDCKKTFPVKLDCNAMTITIRKNCTSEIYKEDK